MTLTARPETLLKYSAAATGEELGPDPFETSIGQETDKSIAPSLTLDERRLKAVRSRAVADERGSNPAVALRNVAAWAEGLTYKQVATLVGVNATELKKLLHGEKKISATREERIRLVSNILGPLRSLLQEQDIGRWLTTGVPALNGKTPLDVIHRHDGHRVQSLVESYFDPGYR